MTRLRYVKNLETGLYESAPVLTGHGHSIAQYNESTLEYSLLQYDTKAVILKGQAKNKPALIKTLRSELVKLGANFGSEIRTRKNAVLELKVAV